MLSDFNHSPLAIAFTRDRVRNKTTSISLSKTVNDGIRNMDNWRIDARQRLALLYDSLNSPKTESEIPRYVLETLLANVQKTLLSTLDAESVRSLVVGALRMIGDTETTNDDDSIVGQLLHINEIVSPEDPESPNTAF